MSLVQRCCFRRDHPVSDQRWNREKSGWEEDLGKGVAVGYLRQSRIRWLDECTGLDWRKAQAKVDHVVHQVRIEYRLCL